MNELLDWLARGTLHATLVAMLVLLTRALLLRRLPPRLLSLLWMILLVRMVLPWAPGSALSIHNLVGDPWAADSQTAMVSPDPSLWATGAPEMAPADADAVRAGASLRGSDGSLSLLAARMTPAGLLAATWFGGVLLLAGLTIAINIVHWRRMRQAPAVTDAGALRLLRRCRRKMRLTRDPCLIETERVRNPALFGLIGPRLLLPTGTIAALTRTELRHVFMHELAHLKRRDIPLSWLAAGLQIVHWFNPLIWFAFRRWRADRETMCDALALAHIPAGESHCYAETLVLLAERRSGPSFVPSLASLLERNAELQRRISMINKHDMWRRRTPWVALGVIALVAFISLTNAQTKRSDAPGLDDTSPTWLTADGTRPEYVPETSWLDENGRIVDETDYPFVDDPAVLGVWTSVDFVEDITDFDPAQPRWRGDLYMQKLDFLAGGGTRVQAARDSGLRPGPWEWTKGLLMHRGGDHSAAAYVIESIDGVDYLFLEWKSGDYIVRHAKPAYYVFVWSADSADVDARSLFDDDDSRDSSGVYAAVPQPPAPIWTSDDTRPDYVPETSWLDEDGRIRDKIDYPFVGDPAVLGLWISVDFVEEIGDFDPAQPRWRGEFYLQKLDFLAEGDTRVQAACDSGLRPAPWEWTNGLLMHRGGDHSAAKYVIESIDGVDYLFLEWKSGDYIIRHMKPAYYVLRRLD